MLLSHLKKFLNTLLLISTMACGLVACQTPSSNEGAPQITISDALNREVSFSTPPNRIIIAGKALFTIVDAFYFFPEAVEKLAALGDLGQMGKSAFYTLVDPNEQQKELMASEAGAEQIAALKPDVVILKSYLAEQLGKSIELLGIPVVYVGLETPEQYIKDIQNIGKLLNNTQQAENVNRYYQERMAFISKRVQSIQEKPSALILYYTDKDGSIAFNVPPMQWIQAMIIENAAATPVWKDANIGKGWTKVGFEQIAAWNPDYIFVAAYFNDIDQVMLQLKADARWQELKAYQKGHLYGFPVDFISWDQADTRWILGQLWVAKTIHPTLFQDLDLHKELTQFYTLYRLSEQDIQTKILPIIKGDFP